MNNILDKKYNFSEIEEKCNKSWKRNKIYEFDENSSNPIFSIDTPPPTVSASHLHTGHVMSYSQMDFIARYKRMRGYNVFYPMRYDDNGVPTERHTEKVYKISASKTEIKQFLELCDIEKNKCANEYKKLWEKIAISVDWSKTYSTIDSTFQRISQKSFIHLLKNGIAYRKNEPFYWSTKAQTALSENDLQNKEMRTWLNNIVFRIDDKDYVVSTTRPELLAACVALFANPKDKRYINLKNKRAIVPIYKYEVPIYFDKNVDINYGSGLMMVCTWGDKEDVIKWKKYKLPIRTILNKDGTLNENSLMYVGLSIDEARSKIIQDLDNWGFLKGQKKINHIIKIDDRYENPIEILATDQWFIKTVEIKQELLKFADQIEWFPVWTKEKNKIWINNLSWDWCISRQRFHGVPIPVWYHKKSGKIIVPLKSELPVDPRNDSLPKSISNIYSEDELIPECDVFDTWATSGCTPYIGCELINNEKIRSNLLPISLHPQAIDNVTVWAFYCMVISYHNMKNIPFKQVMTTGHGVDKNGHKISKRLGNYIDPFIKISEYGADSLRYWATGAKLGKNLKYNEDEIIHGRNLINKLWNSLRYISLNLQNYSYEEYVVDLLSNDDLLIIKKFDECYSLITKYYEDYEISKAVKLLDNFFWNDFCNEYLEKSKSRIENNNVKSVLYKIGLGLIKMYAPVIPYVTEEIYSKLYKTDLKVKSIHLLEW